MKRWLHAPASRSVALVGALALVAGSYAIAAGASAQERAAAGSGGIDCSRFQQLLDEYLSVTSQAGEPLETRFDYTRLYNTPEGSLMLNRIRADLFAVTPSKMNDRTRLAWAINAYNFLVIETLTRNLYDRPVKKRKKPFEYYSRTRFESVQQIHLALGSFFEAPLVEVEGVQYSLNSFERHFVFGDYDLSSNSPPPRRLDPRAHFALVCAAQGCPPLLPRCYRADSLEHQLEWATRNAMSSPRHLRWNHYYKRLEGSAIFDWYRADFGGSDGVLAFVERYAHRDTLALIESRDKPWFSPRIPWDWSLNHTPTEEGKTISPSTDRSRSGL